MTTIQQGGPVTVKDYHNGLAQHLLDLIRKTKSGSTINTTHLNTNQSSASTSPPANPRQLSDSSLESNSKISSGQTTESKPSTSQHHTTGNQVKIVGKPASSMDDSGVDADGERSDGDLDGEDEGSQSDGASVSQRHDQTARPDLHDTQFLTLPHSNTITRPTYSTAESSATAAKRASELQSPVHAALSSRSSSSRPSPNHDAGPTPQAQAQTQDDHLTREDEHRKAWESDGKRVWRNLAPHFELRLEKKPRAESNASSAVSPARSVLSGPSGAGPGTAIRADQVFIPDNEVETKLSEHLSISLPTDRESVSEVSRPEEQVAQSQSQSSVSMSIAKPTIKRSSTLQKRQARLEAESEEEADGLRSPVDNTPTKATAAGPSHTHSNSEVKNNQLSPSDNEQHEYQVKREARLRKKEQSLAKRVSVWRSEVLKSGLQDTSTPDIDPHLPSPSMEASRLRFEPLPPNMPDIMGAHSPDLQMPPLKLIEDNRKSRALRLIPEQTTGESDVDLLIRLTELNRISSAHANSFRGAFPPGASPYGAHVPLGLRTGTGSGLISGAVETHSFRVKDSMPTPRVRSHHKVGTFETFPPI